mmetsp:Transcript_68804/g.154065  ORF Transcript_68804/g.154065 Transcript_68804/m.154065 type:complete len:253 (+) Transcript_68804:275-1033(+)
MVAPTSTEVILLQASEVGPILNVALLVGPRTPGGEACERGPVLLAILNSEGLHELCPGVASLPGCLVDAVAVERVGGLPRALQLALAIEAVAILREELVRLVYRIQVHGVAMPEQDEVRQDEANDHRKLDRHAFPHVYQVNQEGDEGDHQHHEVRLRLEVGDSRIVPDGEHDPRRNREEQGAHHGECRGKHLQHVNLPVRLLAMHREWGGRFGSVVHAIVVGVRVVHGRPSVPPGGPRPGRFGTLRRRMERP